MIGEPIRRVLFVDDDAMLRSANVQTLALAGLAAHACADANEALRTITADFPGVVVTDVRMPGMDGLALFKRLHDLDPDLPVILITGHADVPMAVAALKNGAWDFLAKPFASEHLVASVRRALATRQLVLENRALRSAAQRAAAGDALVGETPTMQRMRRTMRQLANADVDVLVEGEPGTGKELVATMIHRWSARRDRRFATFDCGGLPVDVAQSELFGHATPAGGGHRVYDGRIMGADGGTLFLDGLDGLPLALQATLLRTMEERELMPFGGDRPRQVNVRFVASVTESAESLMAKGRLRPELYYRLSVARLRVPPLRERREDIPLLFAGLAQEAAARLRLPVPDLDASLLSRLANHDWPGNVRELAHVAEETVLSLDQPLSGAAELPLPERTQRFETEAICAALATCDGDVRTTIAALGIPRKTFYDKVTRYSINLGDYRRRVDS